MGVSAGREHEERQQLKQAATGEVRGWLRELVRTMLHAFQSEAGPVGVGRQSSGVMAATTTAAARSRQYTAGMRPLPSVISSLSSPSSLSSFLLRVPLALLVASPLPALSSSVSTSAKETFDRQLAPGGFDEVCVRLAQGEAIDYRFEAAGPVDFNVHYHRGKDVFYPVRQSQVRSAAAQFRASEADDYCLMWENKGTAAVRLQGTVSRQR